MYLIWQKLKFGQGAFPALDRGISPFKDQLCGFWGPSGFPSSVGCPRRKLPWHQLLFWEQLLCYQFSPLTLEDICALQPCSSLACFKIKLITYFYSLAFLLEGLCVFCLFAYNAEAMICFASLDCFWFVTTVLFHNITSFIWMFIILSWILLDASMGWLCWDHAGYKYTK